MKNTKIAPILGLALLHVLITTHMVAQSVFGPRGGLPPVAMAILGSALVGGLLFPRALAYGRRYAAPSPWPRLPGLALISLFILPYPGVLLAGLAFSFPPEALRLAGGIGLGLLYPVAGCVFFSRLDHRRLGLGFGLCIAAGAVVSRHYPQIVAALPWPPEQADALFHLALLGPFLILTARHFRPAEALNPPPRPPYFAAAPARNLKLLLGGCCVLFVMNGFLSVTFFPHVLPINGRPTSGLYLATAGLCLAAGCFLDRYPDRAFRFIFSAGAWLLVATPSLLVLGGTPQLQSLIFGLASIVHMVFFLVITVAAGGLAANPAQAGGLASVTLGLRVLTWLTPYAAAPWLESLDFGIQVLLTTILAFLFYQTIRQVGLPGDAGRAAPEPAADAEVPDENVGGRSSLFPDDNFQPQRLSAAHCPIRGTALRPHPESIQPAAAASSLSPSPADALELFYERHGLTPREREVASMLTRGATNRDISETLSIAENTVKNHVRNLLGKTGFPNRRAFLANLLELAKKT